MKKGSGTFSCKRFLTPFFLVLAAPAFAQNVPDPGRRLTPEEIKALDADPERSAAQKLETPKGAHSPKNPQACDRARTNYILVCGAPNSNKSYSRACAEGRDIYERACAP